MNKRLLQILFFFLCQFVGGTVFAQGGEFQWVNMDGSVEAEINSVAYTSSGDYVYVGGWINGAGGTAFPSVATAGDGRNGFVGKYGADGTLIWSFNIGGSGIDEVTAVAVDGNGDLIVGGYFTTTSGADFSGVSGGPSNLGSTGGKDVFLAKYNSLGILVWVNQGTSANDDQINDIAIDASSNIFVAGTSYGNFSYGGTNASQGGAGDGFAMRVLTSGAIAWMRTLDTTGEDEFLGVTVFNGFAYFGGYYSGTRTFYLLGIIPIGISSTGGSADLVVAKFDALNGELDELETFNGSGEDKIYSLTNDGTDLFFTGSMMNSLTIGSDTYSRGNKEIVTAKLDDNLSRIWSRVSTQTNSGSSIGKDIAALPNGNVVVTGSYSGTINTGVGSIGPSVGGTDGIILTYDGALNSVIQQLEVSSTGDVVANSIAVKGNIETFIGGSNIGATTFAPLGSFSATNGFNHPFLSVLGCTPATATISGSTSICSGANTDLTFTFTGNTPYDISYSDGTSTFTVNGITTATHTIAVAPPSTATYSISAFTSGSCASVFSGSAVITVVSGISNNVIFSDTTHCGPSGSTFTGTVPVGGGSTGVTYYWQYKNTFNNWVGGVNTNNLQGYQSSNDIITREYRRQVNAGGCPTSISNIVTATILPVLSNNSTSGNQQSCGDFDPVAFTGSSPSGGDGSFSYIWEKDTLIGFTTPTTAGTGITFNPPVTSQTYYYRRIVQSSVCSDTASTITVEIDPIIQDNSIGTDQMYCYSVTPLPFVSTPATGGNGTYGYTWQSSSDLLAWTNKATTESYASSLLTSTTYFRRVVTSGLCSDTSNVVVITINTAIGGNSITTSGATTICQDSVPSIVNGSSPTGGANSTYTYLWQESPDNSGWSGAAGTNNAQSYTPAAQSALTYYRRMVNSSGCSSSLSNVVAIDVFPAISNNTISTNQTICANTSPALLTGATPTGGDGGTITYEWQSSSDNVSFSVLVGTNTISYQPSVLTSTTYYRRKVSRGSCGDHFSNSVTITVEPAIANNIISTDQMLCGAVLASPLDGSVATGGTGTMVYNWYSSTDSSTWTNVASTEDFSPGTVSQTTYYFRTVVSGTCAIDTSNIITIGVVPAFSGNSISANHNICNGESPDLLAGNTVTGGTGVLTYSWISSADSMSWTAASGLNSGTDFQAFAITDTTWYRRVVNAGTTCSADTSNTIQVNVEDSISNNVLTSPSTLCSNDVSGTIAGSLPGNGDGTYAFQWQESSDNISWSSVGGATSQNLTIGAIATDTYYRRIVTSGECGTDTSSAVLQVVSPFITSNSITNNQFICYDSIPNSLTGAVQSPGSFVFAWQESLDSAIFVNASGVFNTASFQPSNLTQTTYYQRIIKSGACPNDTSNILKIEVIPLITNNTISSDTTVCFGSTGIDINGSIPSGGDGNYIYAWESSTDGVTYITASGTGPSNVNGFTTSTLNQTTYFRRIVYSTSCLNDSLVSTAVTITVEPALSANTISADQVLCGDYTVSTLTGSVVTGGNGTPDYQWQSSIDLISWNNEVTTQDYSPGTISDTMYYRRKVTSGSCLIESISDTVTVIYLAAISPNNIQSNDTICIGGSPATFTNVLLPPGGGNGAYAYSWEQSSDNISWTSALGTPSGSSFNADPLSDTTYFRRIIGSSVCYLDTSNVLTVIVEDLVGNNTITIPADVCSSSTSDSIFGSVPSGGNTVYNYQWQVYDSTLTAWVNAPGVNTNQDYALGTITDSAYYRRIVGSGQCGTDTSLAVLLAVQPAINTNTIGTDEFICLNTAPQNLTGTIPTGNGFVYTWESSTDGVNYILESSGNNAQDFQPGNLDTTTFYRRIITSGVCGMDTSNLLTISVWDSLANNTIFNDTAICFDADPVVIVSTAISGGSGNYAYLWEESLDGVSFWTPTANSTSSNFTTGNLTQTMFYRRRVTDVSCVNDTLFSNIIEVTVHSKILHDFAVVSDTVCIGDDVDIVFQMSGEGPFSMMYNDNGNFSTPTNIAGSVYNLTITPSASGMIIVDTLWDVNGCYVVPEDTFRYRVVTYPIVDLGIDSTVCDEYTFNPSFGSGSLSFSSPTLGTLSNSFPLAFTPNTFGTHQFILEETVENCANSDTVEITFEESIGFISAGDDIYPVLEDSTYLYATDLLPNQTGYWTLISGGGSFSDSTDPNATFLELISGVTTLEWTVEQPVCPSRSDQVLVVVQNLLVPTGFSPNGDGNNDFLEIAGREDVNTINVQVFDRWGGLVFSDKDYQNDWYGTTNSGDDLPEDTYFVIIDLGAKGIHKSYLMIRR